MTQRLDQSAIDGVRARHSLVAMVGRRVKLRRAGRGWSGLCPFHDEKTPSFTVSDERGFYHCFGCGAHGDLFRWVQETQGVGFREAVAALADGALPDARAALPDTAKRAAAERRIDVVDSMTAGRWIFRSSGPARGEIVEAWLASRGLDPLVEFLPGVAAIDQLRFHPRCPVSAWRVGDEPGDPSRLTAPAMVAPIADGEGAVWGVHVTFLSADGRSKAVLPMAQGRERPARKMFGKVAGNAVLLTPAETLCSEAPMVVGEGIETAWSFAQVLGRPCRVAATLSLQNLQGRALTTPSGALPIGRVQSDPEGPPFTLPHAGEVIVLVDADMKPLRRQKVQPARGQRPVIADLDGLQRAELCATLASQAWKRAGATKVSAVRPRMGWDFNDAARAA